MKRARIIVVLLLMFSFTGCIKEYTYTDEQTDAAAEYMAGKLLEQDDHYRQALLPMNEVRVEPTVSVSPTAVPIQNSDPVSTVSSGAVTVEQKEYTLSQVIGAEDFDLLYEGYSILDSYPEDSTDTYFTVTPRKGNQLAVVTFLLKNKTDKKKTLNLTKADIRFQLDINVGTMYEPSLSLIENDLQYIDISLKGNGEKQVLLIFEIKKEKEISDINLMVSHKEKSAIIVLK